jgi:hypothetical protein
MERGKPYTSSIIGVKMNKNFVRIIFTEEQDKNFIRLFAGAMSHTLNESLLESAENQITFESYTTSEGHHVYEVALTQELSNERADEMANTIASVIKGDYEIEVSGNGYTVQ